MSTGNRRWTWLSAALLAITIGIVAAACGGSSSSSSSATSAAADTSAASSAAAPGTAIKMGFLSNCEGPFGPFWDATLAGFYTSLVQFAGATPVDPKSPKAGVTGAMVPGTQVPINIDTNYGCSNDNADKALSEAKRLVEQDGVNILIGPLSGDEGIAVANYAKTQPNVTFLNGISGAQDTTLKVQAPNFFRFATDGAQWTAGLGAYAYNVLGWRTAVTIGDDYSFPYTQTAGFVSEFCSLGGKITDRIWPALGETDYSSYIAKLPKDVDGYFLDIGGTGTVQFVKQYTQVNGDSSLKGKVMGGAFISNPQIIKELGSKVSGVVAGSALPSDATDANWTTYADAIKAAFPDQAANAANIFLWGYYTNTQAAILGLKAVGGNVDDAAALQSAIAGTEIAAGTGPMTVDGNRNGVASNYVVQVSSTGTKTLFTVPNVDQTFGGAFSTSTPSPDRTNPKCVAGNPPPWAASITK
ncbi:MAG: ABC transporter substrate-binding protein [Thermoleophilia bacterium]